MLKPADDNLIKVVVFAGGTGGRSTLNSLMMCDGEIHPIHIIPNSDDGGSSGRMLTDGFIDFPPGDIGQSILARSNWSTKHKNKFTQRDKRGDSLMNHTISIYRTMSSNAHQAIRDVEDLFECHGQGLLATEHRSHLKAISYSGEHLEGEHQLDEFQGSILECQLRQVTEDKPLMAHPEALEAIRQADIIIIGPGSFYTSVIPIFLVPEIKQAVADSSAPVIGVGNLANDGQTHGWTAHQYGTQFCRMIGRPISHLLVNSGTIPQWLVEHYQGGADRGKQDIVQVGEKSSEFDYQTVEVDLLSQISKRDTSQAGGVKRSVLRHDHRYLGTALTNIFTDLGFERQWAT